MMLLENFGVVISGFIRNFDVQTCLVQMISRDTYEFSAIFTRFSIFSEEIERLYISTKNIA